MVGSYTDSADTHGFVYSISAGSFATADDPHGVDTTVMNGINDNGVLVGFYGTSPSGGVNRLLARSKKRGNSANLQNPVFSFIHTQVNQELLPEGPATGDGCYG